MSFETLPIVKDALQIPGLLKEIYTDALKPGVSQVGTALGTILGLGNTILLPIYLANERARLAIENNLEKYRESLRNVPEADVVPVRAEVGVPILEKLMYVTDDELSALYINLLSKASTVQTAAVAHPGFVHIINCLSPDEAILLKAVWQRGRLAFVETILQHPDHTYRVIKDLCTGLEDEIKLSFGENVEAYISNAAGHGILDIRRDVRVADPPVYESLKVSSVHRQNPWNGIKINRHNLLAFRRGKIEITPFGELFLEACLKKLAAKK